MEKEKTIDHALRATWQAVAKIYNEQAAKHESTMAMAMALLYIDFEKGTPSTALGPSMGMEATSLSRLLKNMEDNRGKFAVIVAGYPENMENFLKMNPGLKSRFDKTLIFKDYNPETLYEICVKMFKAEDLTPDKQAEEHLKKYIKSLYKARDKYFGNARTVRKIVAEGVRKQNLRMASVPARKRSVEAVKTLTFQDVKDIEVNKALGSSGSIGF
jgi:hypothetical protein